MNLNRMTRFVLMSLVFFFIWEGCQPHSRPDKPSDVKILWNIRKAARLSISKRLTGELDKAQAEKQVLIYLDTNDTPILGEYDLTADEIIFTPLIPFTRGKTYRVKIKGKQVRAIEIDTDIVVAVPGVMEVYPTRDTVPENLLKIYIEFSQPMKEGEALQHIVLIKNDRDTLHDEFLDLQPELWNDDRTVLTLWFDPGRIKRDLQPNLKMGPPLIKGNKYTLIVKNDWENEDGKTLGQIFVKNFIAGDYDNLSPNTRQWKIVTPKAGTNNPLEVDFNESLDYMLVKNAISIMQEGGKYIAGDFNVHKGEMGFSFVPESPWQKGEYVLSVEARMEDLAGNNLDRLFERDLMKKPPPYVQKVQTWHLKIE